ncbi:PHD finger protein 13 isoform X2 [Ambystoma mexicanum]
MRTSSSPPNSTGSPIDSDSWDSRFPDHQSMQSMPVKKRKRLGDFKQASPYPSVLKWSKLGNFQSDRKKTDKIKKRKIKKEPKVPKTQDFVGEFIKFACSSSSQEMDTCSSPEEASSSVEPEKYLPAKNGPSSFQMDKCLSANEGCFDFQMDKCLSADEGCSTFQMDKCLSANEGCSSVETDAHLACNNANSLERGTHLSRKEADSFMEPSTRLSSQDISTCLSSKKDTSSLELCTRLPERAIDCYLQKGKPLSGNDASYSVHENTLLSRHNAISSIEGDDRHSRKDAIVFVGADTHLPSKGHHSSLQSNSPPSSQDAISCVEDIIPLSHNATPSVECNASLLWPVAIPSVEDDSSPSCQGAPVSTDGAICILEKDCNSPVQSHPLSGLGFDFKMSAASGQRISHLDHYNRNNQTLPSISSQTEPTREMKIEYDVVTVGKRTVIRQGKQVVFRDEDGLGNDEDIMVDSDDESWHLVTCFCMKPFAGRPMIECNECNTWIHLSCAKIRKSCVPEIYICQKCRDTKFEIRRSNRSRYGPRKHFLD